MSNRRAIRNNRQEENSCALLQKDQHPVTSSHSSFYCHQGEVGHHLLPSIPGSNQTDVHRKLLRSWLSLCKNYCFFMKSQKSKVLNRFISTGLLLHVYIVHVSLRSEQRRKWPDQFGRVIEMEDGVPSSAAGAMVDIMGSKRAVMSLSCSNGQLMAFAKQKLSS